MNNRDYKRFTPGSIFHIYNRGNNKEDIYLNPDDYRAFLYRLGICLGYKKEELGSEEETKISNSRIRINASPKGSFKLYQFCLMPNHFHVLIEQVGDIPLSNLVSKLCASYSKYLTKKYNKVGHIFQDCFKAVLIEDSPQLMWTSSYIHNNPVKDKIVKSPQKYNWSSYRDYIGERSICFVEKDLIIATFENLENFIEQTFSADMPKRHFGKK